MGLLNLFVGASNTTQKFLYFAIAIQPAIQNQYRKIIPIELFLVTLSNKVTRSTLIQEHL